MKVFKIILGLLLLLVGLQNLTGLFDLPNARQAAGYLIVTLFFILAGGWLLYSGVKPKRDQPKIYDASENKDDSATN